MKSWIIKIWLNILLVLAILFFSALLFTYLFLNWQGQNILINSLTNLTHKKVTVAHFSIRPPLNLHIKNLEIEGLAKVRDIRTSPNPLTLFLGYIGFNDLEIVEPEFTFERGADKNAASALPAASLALASPGAVKPNFKEPVIPFVFKRISIKDGRIDFTDRVVTPEGIKITFKDIQFSLSNVYAFPRSVITNFDLEAKIPWGEAGKEGRVSAEGWLNFFKKDIQAVLKIEDIDGIYLYPYYANWVDLEKARIDAATLNFTSDIQGLNNDVIAECHLELADIVRRPLNADESQEKAARIADTVLEIFKAFNQGKIVLNFTIRTKMDRPEFGFGNIKTAFENKISEARKSGGFGAEDVLAFPTRLLGGAFKGLTGLTTTVITGTINAGKEIKNAVGDTFKKEKKEQNTSEEAQK
jgi:hypothetical protein